MNITSNTNSPDNETRKLVEGVVPPQLVADEESSSAWKGVGAAGGVADAVAAASTFRGSVGAGGGGADPAGGGVAES